VPWLLLILKGEAMVFHTMEEGNDGEAKTHSLGPV